MKILSLLSTLLMLLLLNVAFSFARTEKTYSIYNFTASSTTTRRNSNEAAYDSLSLQMKGLSRDAFQYAIKGFSQLIEKGLVSNDSILTIVDFSQSSSHKRLYVIDLKNYLILFNSLVAHGRNSGLAIANHFSNENSSYMSSPGFYTTGYTYEGHSGYSLQLDGLEKGINDRAKERAIVIHGAPYVSEEIVRMQGYSGRSQGCPAVPVSLARPLINTIRNGSCVFVYHPSYVRHSSILTAA